MHVQINGNLAGKAIDNATVFSVEIQEETTSRYDRLPVNTLPTLSDALSYTHSFDDGVPTVITVLSEEGGSNKLREGLEKELVVVAQELKDLNFSFAEVQRFGELWLRVDL